MTIESSPFIPGYLGTITLNAEDVSAAGNVWRLDQTKDLMVKAVFGNRGKRVLGGQIAATIGFDGHGSPAAIAALQAAFVAEAPITASLQIGEADGLTDAGLYTGTVVLGTFGLNANADGEVDFSATGQFDGLAAFAAAGGSS